VVTGLTAGGGEQLAAASSGFVSAPAAGDHESTRHDGVASSRPLDAPAAGTPADAGLPASAPRADPAAAARIFDPATTRRRSVVFEEDDELDVPDFLK